MLQIREEIRRTSITSSCLFEAATFDQDLSAFFALVETAGRLAATANENCGFLESVVSDDVNACVGRLRLVILFWFDDFQGEFEDCVLK